jgi:hypothetical protein
MNIQQLAEAVHATANELFPARTDNSMYLKLYSETAEVIESKGKEDEVADIFILWLDYAVRKNINIEAAVMKKLAILEQRNWECDGGVYQHVD